MRPSTPSEMATHLVSLRLFSLFFRLVCFFSRRIELLIKIQAFDEDTVMGKPFKALQTSTRAAYVSTGQKFITYLLRRSRKLGSPLPNLRGLDQQVSAFGQRPTLDTLQSLLMEISKIWDDVPATRDDHLVGDFIKLSSVRRDGNFASLTSIHHTIAHLLYWVRLAVFRQIHHHRANEADTLKRIHPA